jgi:hypothetical protein
LEGVSLRERTALPDFGSRHGIVAGSLGGLPTGAAITEARAPGRVADIATMQRGADGRLNEARKRYAQRFGMQPGRAKRNRDQLDS